MIESLIELAADRFPNECAFDDGQRRVTYTQLKQLVSRFSSSDLAELNEGNFVAWCPRNDLNGLVTFWAMQERGLVACPISHRLPQETIDKVVRHLEAAWLAPIDIEARFPDEAGGLCNVEAKRVVDTRENSNVLAGNWEADPNRPATIILTSGSTGLPKPVVHSMNAHVQSAIGAATVIPLAAGDRWLWSLPLCHVSGMSILIRCAVVGATVVGLPAASELTPGLLSNLEVSHLSVVMTQLRRLMSNDSFPPPCLKSVLLGGGSADAKLVQQARARGVNLHTTYGLTEMASQVTTSGAAADPSGSGKLLPGRKLQLSNDGEILVGGETLCLGYYQSGSIESVADDHGWFHTRDVGSWSDEGQLRVQGRIDNQFISGGENIHPENIERAMIDAFGVDHVIVVPKHCDTYGERPVAFVAGTIPPDWRDRLRERLAGFEIPVEIMPWPTEADGDIKPNRRKLRELVSR